MYLIIEVHQFLKDSNLVGRRGNLFYSFCHTEESGVFIK